MQQKLAKLLTSDSARRAALRRPGRDRLNRKTEDVSTGMRTHGPLNVETFVDPIFAENGLLLWRHDRPDCWIVDPGFPPQPEEMAAAIQDRELTPTAIMLTHCHPDHIVGVGPLRRLYPDLPIAAPRGEEHMLIDADANMSSTMGVPITTPPADRLLEPGQTHMLGELEWRMLDVSGHSPAGLAFHCEQAGVVVGGDALFSGGIGRYDLPGSSRERLLRNIVENLLTLPDDTVLYSGHGGATTIGRERAGNLVLRDELRR
jgi:glyoxylase-like metal-dependent hydrolase (beta-lactamase superfamily II)